MRVSIEDLEALKELNDEIEENHVEAERAMQEEIGAHALILHLSWRVELDELTEVHDHRRKGRPNTRA
jgi:hypothetical protein